MNQKSLTGRGPRRRTRRGVRVAERVAKGLITIGGVGTILAVTLIFVFLVWVVAPLFMGGEPSARDSIARGDRREPVAHVVVDEYLVLAAEIDAAGVARAWRLDNGELVSESRPFGDARPACHGARGDTLAFGFADGTARLYTPGFSSEFVPASEREAVLARMGQGELATIDGALVQRTRDGSLRRQRFAPSASEPLELKSGVAIEAIDASIHDEGGIVFARHADGTLALARLERSENPFTGEVESSLEVHPVPFESTRADAPARVLVLGEGDRLMAVWADGDAVRFDARDPSEAKAAERLDLVDGDGEVRALDLLVGRNTLLVGESTGKVGAWFGTKPDSGPRPLDGVVFVRAHEFDFGDSPVVALAASARNRSFLAGTEDGTLRLGYATSGKLVAEVALRDAGAIDSLAIAPKDDAIVASHRAGLSSWSVDLGHPEATLAALFAPVWYEGYPRADHTWQSSSGSDDFEAKFGLLPLVFGTLKATFYSMLFGVPLALLAAIYTSEFLSPRLRAPLKSMTEMMASLPSVVLGFIAALVIAPLVKDILPALLAMLVTVPFMLLLGAHMWQMQRADRIVRWSGLPRFAATAAMLPAGALLGLLFGGLFEDLLFGGDLVAWLSGGPGGAVGGFFVLLLPVSVLVVGWLSARHVAPWLRRRSKGWSRQRIAAADLGKFLACTLAVLALASFGGWVLSGSGFDARGGVLDTYDQRNALIVGFVMGFAVIPIIYTLAEDALSSVPAHLRLASLGAGATQWQTASRVVVPTAMSGLFSALMIGLGRAVGETMIVLMAAGNTPLMSWNIFDGFRTLSANIAVELPEAVRDSTHYRTLFLAGLCLFAMTFVLNTLAEVVRQRVRRRSYQL